MLVLPLLVGRWPYYGSGCAVLAEAVKGNARRHCTHLGDEFFGISYRGREKWMKPAFNFQWQAMKC
jgi:hypothetical protein